MIGSFGTLGIVFLALGAVLLGVRVCFYVCE